MTKRYQVVETSSWNPSVKVRFEADTMEEIREWWKHGVFSVHTRVVDTQKERPDE